MNVALRLATIALLLAARFAGAHVMGARLLLPPQAVGLAIGREALSGALAFNLGVSRACRRVVHDRDGAWHRDRAGHAPTSATASGTIGISRHTRAPYSW